MRMAGPKIAVAGRSVAYAEQTVSRSDAARSLDCQMKGCSHDAGRSALRAGRAVLGIAFMPSVLVATD